MLTRLYVVFLAATGLVACGGGEDTVVDHTAPKPPPVDAAFAEIAPVIAANCGKCHNGTVHPLNFADKAVFKASKAKARLTAGTMPPAPNTISDGDKAKLLAYLQ